MNTSILDSYIKQGFAVSDKQDDLQLRWICLEGVLGSHNQKVRICNLLKANQEPCEHSTKYKAAIKKHVESQKHTGAKNSVARLTFQQGITIFMSQ